MKKLFLLIPLLPILTACQPPMTREQELAIYRSRCLDYGFHMGTREFAKCMQQQEAQEALLYMHQRQIQAMEDLNCMEWERVRAEQDWFRFQQDEARRDRLYVKQKTGQVVKEQRMLKKEQHVLKKERAKLQKAENKLRREQYKQDKKLIKKSYK